MKAKLLAGVAVVALTACTVFATAGTASAQWRGHGWGPGAVAAGVIGGAVAAATSPLWAPYSYAPYGYYGYSGSYAPYYDVAPGPIIVPGAAVAGGGTVAWCEARYHSYNVTTGMFLGYDGQYHPCP